MKIFRTRKISGKSTKKEEKVKTIGSHAFVCKCCGYTVNIPYVNEKELTVWVKDNEWIQKEDGLICPRCIALGVMDEKTDA